MPRAAGGIAAAVDVVNGSHVAQLLGFDFAVGMV